MSKTEAKKAIKQIIFVTGLSGAGLSSALKALEDMGYEVLDNFPLNYTDRLVNESESDGRPIAFGIDTRSRGFSPEAVINATQKNDARLVFMTCDEMILQKRFTETRRRHPLAQDRPVADGIKKEQALLYPLRDMADPVIDTSELSIHDLRRIIQGHFDPSCENDLSVSLMSFGFKHGLPREADIAMDVRFLRNPHWDKDLKPLTGQDPKIGTYIEEDDAFMPFIEHFKTLIEPLLPRYTHEGKSYLTLAIGCTGGRHRSVYIVETLAKWLENLGVTTHIQHRDMDR